MLFDNSTKQPSAYAELGNDVEESLIPTHFHYFEDIGMVQRLQNADFVQYAIRLVLRQLPFGNGLDRSNVPRDFMRRVIDHSESSVPQLLPSLIDLSQVFFGVL